MVILSEVKLNRFYDLHRVLLTNKFRVGTRSLSDDSSSEKPKTNLYKTLGVPQSATASEIKQAYYDLSFKYHPDRNEDNVEAADKFREVTEAYEVLGNYGLKKRYDKGLPLPLSKRESAPLRPVQEPNVPLQKFFDSRHTKWSDRRGVEEEMPPEAPQESDFDRRNRRFNEDFESSKSVRGFLAFAIIISAILYKVYMK